MLRASYAPLWPPLQPSLPHPPVLHASHQQAIDKLRVALDGLAESIGLSLCQRTGADRFREIVLDRVHDKGVQLRGRDVLRCCYIAHALPG